MVKTAKKGMVFFCQNCSNLLWEKKCSGDWERLLKFEAEGREFAKILRSLEQSISNKHLESKLEKTIGI